MKAITIRQPWASLIAHGIKDIENRTWKCPTKHIGTRVLIHAAVKTSDFWDCPNYGIVHNHIREVTKYGIDYSKYNTMAIIGSVEIADCVVNHQSIWAEKTIDSVCPLCHRIVENKKVNRQYCIDCRRVLDKGIDYAEPIYNWVLANPILFDEPIMNVKGKLGFWDYEFSEDDYECTNDNGYTLGSCGEKVGCIQDCGRCDYYKCKYEIE